MESIGFFLWFFVIGPLLPFLALVGTGLMILALRVLATLVWEHQ